MASGKTTSETLIQRLETARSMFDDDPHPLSTYQSRAFYLCCDLLWESEASQAQRSRQHRISRKRVRNLLIDVYRDLGADVFLLCTLAASISKLATITHEGLLPKIRAWWKAAARPLGLREIASELCDDHLKDVLIAPTPKRQRAALDTGMRNLPIFMAVSNGDVLRYSAVHSRSSAGGYQSKYHSTGSKREIG